MIMAAKADQVGSAAASDTTPFQVTVQQSMPALLNLLALGMLGLLAAVLTRGPVKAFRPVPLR
jgi:hypothetical protein